MNKILYSKFKPGRLFVVNLPHGKDLISTIEEFCLAESIQMAKFSVIGAVSSITIGAYDQKQQVYVTFRQETALEILSCAGNVSLKDGNPFVHAHIVLGDEKGGVTGGHLFPETIIFSGELELQELTGKPLERLYDDKTGLMLWKF